VAIGRGQRWERLEPRFAAALGGDGTALRQAAKLFELLEMAWHDCYGELTPPDAVVDDILVCARGTLGGLVEAAQLAVIDFRDLHLQAAHLRAREEGDG
jgi:hypothetical protein